MRPAKLVQTAFKTALQAGLLAGAALFGPAPAAAQDLTIIDRTGSVEHRIILSRADLEGLETGVIQTDTPWTDAANAYSGPRAAAIAALIAGPFTKVKARALNDYEISLPREDFDKNLFVLATRKDGAPMPIREKGPFWVVYDFDAADGVELERWRVRSIWQLSTLIFERD